jgi:hypothetical protein
MTYHSMKNVSPLNPIKISQTKEQIQALSSVQANCEIQGITLLSCSVTRAKAGNTLKEPFSVKPALSNISSSRHDSTLVIEVSFEYSAWDSSEPAERLFLVNCTFEVAYQLRDGYTPSNDELASFSRGTAVFNCWPYAREFLRDITARLGHQTPALPLLRIVPKKPDVIAKQVVEVSSEPAKLPEANTP